MSGNAAQRRRSRRLQERLSKRAMSEGRYPWLDNLISQPEPSGEPEDAIKPTSEDLSRKIPPKGVASSTPKPIAPPEPRGEAEGVLPKYGAEVRCGFCGKLMTKVRPDKYQCDNPSCSSTAFYRFPPKKRRTLWNWLRKLVTKTKRDAN